jgi:hypothetical protein
MRENALHYNLFVKSFYINAHVITVKVKLIPVLN